MKMIALILIYRAIHSFILIATGLHTQRACLYILLDTGFSRHINYRQIWFKVQNCHKNCPDKTWKEQEGSSDTLYFVHELGAFHGGVVGF